MIEIELRSKDGGPYRTEPHATFVDYQLRESGSSSETIVGIHAENLVAPVVAALAGKNALSSYPELAKAAADVAAAFPNAEDAARILALLVPWSRNYPDGLWVIAGAEHVPTDARYIALPKEPRFSARSLSVDPLRHGITFIGEAARMDDMDGVDLDPLERDEISIEEAMKRQRTNPDDKSSGSSGSKGRKKSPDGGGIFIDSDVSNDHLQRETERLDRLAQIDAGTYKPPTVGRKKAEPTRVTRIKATVADAYAIDPGPFAALAHAIAAGTAFAYQPESGEGGNPGARRTDALPPMSPNAE